MKKVLVNRIVSCLLAVALVFSMTPVAFAETENVVQVTSFEELQTAIEGATADITIDLIEDVTVDSAWSINSSYTITITSSQDKTLQFDGGYATYIYSHVVFEHLNVNKVAETSIVLVYTGGTLDIRDVTWSATDTGNYLLAYYGTINVYSGTFAECDYASTWGFSPLNIYPIGNISISGRILGGFTIMPQEDYPIASVTAGGQVIEVGEGYTATEDVDNLTIEVSGPAVVDKTDLETAIESANDLLDSATVSTDGLDVSEDDQWVSVSDVVQLAISIGVAQTVADNADATQDEVDAAVDALNAAIEAFNEVMRDGSYVEPEAADFSALEAAITSARDAINSVAVSADGSDVSEDDQWISIDNVIELAISIGVAQAVVDNESATQDEVDAAVDALNEAIAAFEAAWEYGTYVEPEPEPEDPSTDTGDSGTETDNPDLGTDDGTGADDGTEIPDDGTDSALVKEGWTRLYGDTRYETMAAVVQETFEDNSSDYVVIASGNSYADALSATSLAGVLDAPIILVNTNDITDSARTEIERVGASYAYIIGGTSAISDTVESQVEQIVGSGNVDRLYGNNRMLTAIEVANETYEICEELGIETTGQAIIATGYGYADALSISPYAYSTATPIYLAGSDGLLDSQTLSAIQNLGIDDVLIVGGTSAVSDDVKTQLGDSVAFERLYGDSRYETSVAVANWAITNGYLSANNAAVATGTNYTDALSASALCGQKGSVLLLATDGQTSTATQIVQTYADSITKGYFIGGEGAISSSVAYAFERASGMFLND